MQGGIPAQPFLRQCTTWKGESSLLWGSVGETLLGVLLHGPGVAASAWAVLQCCCTSEGCLGCKHSVRLRLNADKEGFPGIACVLNELVIIKALVSVSTD